jgi:hypothetical protein
MIKGHKIKIINVARVDGDELLNPKIEVDVDGTRIRGITDVEVSTGHNQFPWVTITFCAEEIEAVFEEAMIKSAVEELPDWAHQTFVVNCSSCGGDHAVGFFRTTGVVTVDGDVFTSVGRCPVTGHAIFMGAK